MTLEIISVFTWVLPWATKKKNNLKVLSQREITNHHNNHRLLQSFWSPGLWQFWCSGVVFRTDVGQFHIWRAAQVNNSCLLVCLLGGIMQNVRALLHNINIPILTFSKSSYTGTPVVFYKAHKHGFSSVRFFSWWMGWHSHPDWNKVVTEDGFINQLVD